MRALSYSLPAREQTRRSYSRTPADATGKASLRSMAGRAGVSIDSLLRYDPERGTKRAFLPERRTAPVDNALEATLANIDLWLTPYAITELHCGAAMRASRVDA